MASDSYMAMEVQVDLKDAISKLSSLADKIKDLSETTEKSGEKNEKFKESFNQAAKILSETGQKLEKTKNKMKGIEKETEKSSKNEQGSKSSGKIAYLNAGMHTFLKEDNTYETMVNVSCGAASSNFPVVGKTVGQVRDFYREILNIGFDAKAILNGENEVDNTTILKTGDNLEFIRPAGVKG